MGIVVKDWSDAEKETLRRMRAAGAAYSAIAVVLSRTRSACAAMGMRLGLSVSKTQVCSPAIPVRSLHTPHVPAPVRMPSLPLACGFFTTCQWPIDAKNYSIKCGAPTAGTKPYCAEHCAVAYVPLKPYRRSTRTPAVHKAVAAQNLRAGVEW
jgi:hypothetical protein